MANRIRTLQQQEQRISSPTTMVRKGLRTLQQTANDHNRQIDSPLLTRALTKQESLKQKSIDLTDDDLLKKPHLVKKSDDKSDLKKPSKKDESIGKRKSVKLVKQKSENLSSNTKVKLHRSSLKGKTDLKQKKTLDLSKIVTPKATSKQVIEWLTCEGEVQDVTYWRLMAKKNATQKALLEKQLAEDNAKWSDEQEQLKLEYELLLEENRQLTRLAEKSAKLRVVMERLGLEES